MVQLQLTQGELPEGDGKQQDLAPGEIVIGSLVGIDSQGRPLVSFSGGALAKPLVALSTVGVSHDHVGRQVALLFAQGLPDQPVIMGLIYSPLHDLLAGYEHASAEPEVAPAQMAVDAPAGAIDATIDGQRVVIEAKEEIVLKCGDASITLTRAGKILIRGKYLQSRSAGVNRIMGGSVQIN